ncbi:hypothetical protein SAMN05192553_102403 [Cyclobacterium xiamenense]|uniref:Lipoprotein n=1 Tax=Cyclobacterium xiamenense TaxID=1297121 RepID=A0A1H6W406_9BACT|nr:hypothetical protein [Cyclobacterium xiamenense]SEJ10556.1 hypothetical protein SAMN05192553_102403 [Cyclobacterium xiamenense]
MGTPKFTLGRWFLWAIPFLLLSCHSAEEVELENAAGMVSSEEMANMMGLLEELDLLVFSAMMQQDLTQGKISPILDVSSCPGSVIMRDEKNSRIKVDYGSGCVDERGLQKKGVVTIAYTDSFLIKGSSVTIGFENFSLNGRKLEGTRKLENLGFQSEKRRIRFSSVISDFQFTSLTGETYRLDHSQIKDLHLSTEETGFRIYLEGYGTVSTVAGVKTSFEIIHPVVYLQECMASGNPIPSQGSLQLRGGNQQVLLTFDSGNCSNKR